jgi:hypothetical protein
VLSGGKQHSAAPDESQSSDTACDAENKEKEPYARQPYFSRQVATKYARRRIGDNRDKSDILHGVDATCPACTFSPFTSNHITQ